MEEVTLGFATPLCPSSPTNPFFVYRHGKWKYWKVLFCKYTFNSSIHLVKEDRYRKTDRQTDRLKNNSLCFLVDKMEALFHFPWNFFEHFDIKTKNNYDDLVPKILKLKSDWKTINSLLVKKLTLKLVKSSTYFLQINGCVAWWSG